MQPPPTAFEKLAIALVVILSLIALAVTTVTPAYAFGNDLVYEGF